MIKQALTVRISVNLCPLNLIYNCYNNYIEWISIYPTEICLQILLHYCPSRKWRPMLNAMMSSNKRVGVLPKEVKNLK